ncbi:MAG: hypothetical protein WEC84_04085 [Candidatus Andersenbacteria bacterium]
MKVYVALLAFLGVLWCALSQQVSADTSPVTDDLFDVSQGVLVRDFSPAPLDSRTDIRNLFGGSFGSVEIGNTFFRDHRPAGTVHSVEWVTPTPVRLSRVVIFGYHGAAPFDANVRGIRTLRLYAAAPGEPMQLLHEFSPSNPYGGGALGYELTHEITLDNIVGQRFRAEFVQFGDSRPTASGPMVVEIDGFGEALPALELPPPASDDLWDITQGTTITAHSGVIAQHGGGDIRDMFGGTFWAYEPDHGKTDFRDDKPAGFVHFVEWRTPEPITLERFHLLADHDFFDRGNPDGMRDASSRGFRRFTLLVKDTSGAWQEIYTHTPPNPYGQGPIPYLNKLALDVDVTDIVAQEFRAEFEQFGDIYPFARGPRIEELDGFGSVVSETQRDPIVIVPGLLASFNRKLFMEGKEGGTWRFPYGGNVYYGLEKRLDLENYPDEDVYIAYYDWRKPVKTTAVEYFAPIIEEAKQKTGKVDVIAHSMGGLVVREYLQKEGYTGNEIDQLILLGTPNEGAVDAYVAWEGGIFPERWSFPIVRHARNIETAMNKDRSAGPLPRPLSFRKFFPSLPDLIPTTPFLEQDEKEDFLPGSVTNTLAPDLASTVDNVFTAVNKITALAGTNLPTMQKITLSNDPRTPTDMQLERWRDGLPVVDPPPYDSLEGDETVLLSSALLGSHPILIPGVSHSDLPSKAQDQIIDALGIESVTDVRFEYTPPKSITTIFALSPVDIEIVGPNDEKLSYGRNDFGENADIDGDPLDPDDSTYVTLLNVPEGTYTVRLLGTGEGEFTVVTGYDDSGSSTTSKYTDVISLGEKYQYTFEISDGKLIPPAEHAVQNEIGLFIESQTSETDDTKKAGPKGACCPGPDEERASTQARSVGRVAGVIIQPPACTLLPSLRSAFRDVFGRDMSGIEHDYWSYRLKRGDKQTEKTLVGALQWFKNRGVSYDASLTQNPTITARCLNSSLVSNINQLFRQAFGRNPTAIEHQYWLMRIENGEKTTTQALLGAMQWQASR